MTERLPPAKQPAGPDAPHWAKNRDPTSVADLPKSHCFCFLLWWLPPPPTPSSPPSFNSLKWILGGFSILEGGRQTERFRLLYLICLQSHRAGDSYVEVHSFLWARGVKKELWREPTVPSTADLAPLVPPTTTTTTPSKILRVVCVFIWNCVASCVSLVWQPRQQLPLPWQNALLSQMSKLKPVVGWK